MNGTPTQEALYQMALDVRAAAGLEDDESARLGIAEWAYHTAAQGMAEEDARAEAEDLARQDLAARQEITKDEIEDWSIEGIGTHLETIGWRAYQAAGGRYEGGWQWRDRELHALSTSAAAIAIEAIYRGQGEVVARNILAYAEGASRDLGRRLAQIAEAAHA